jgi:hypothetical protein
MAGIVRASAGAASTFDRCALLSFFDLGAMSKEPIKKVELKLDAWERFERAVDVVAKSPPQHRTKAKTKSGRSPARKRGPIKRKKPS